jgi:hypothetical protein
MCAAMKKGGESGGMMGGMMGGKSGGMMGGGMDGGKTGTAAAPTVTVAPDGSVLILRGSTLFKYDSDLNLRAQAELPAPAAHEHH